MNENILAGERLSLGCTINPNYYVMNYQFKIQLKGITKPPVWRRLLVPATFTFHEFHLLLQDAFGWENEHLYSFCDRIYDSSFSISEPEHVFDLDFVPVYDSHKVTLRDYFGETLSKGIVYWYDFGDDWEHVVKLEALSPEPLPCPRCLAGKGACPPEDCGGITGYAYMKETLLGDSDEANEMREWMGLEEGEPWDAKAFDLDETNALIASRKW